MTTPSVSSISTTAVRELFERKKREHRPPPDESANAYEPNFVAGFEDHVGRFVVFREDDDDVPAMGVVACRDDDGWQIQLGSRFPCYEACNAQKKRCRRYTRPLDLETWRREGRLFLVDDENPGYNPLGGGFHPPQTPRDLEGEGGSGGGNPLDPTGLGDRATTEADEADEVDDEDRTTYDPNEEDSQDPQDRREESGSVEQDEAAGDEVEDEAVEKIEVAEVADEDRTTYDPNEDAHDETESKEVVEVDDEEPPDLVDDEEPPDLVDDEEPPDLVDANRDDSGLDDSTLAAPRRRVSIRVRRVLILCSGTGHDARSFRRLFPGVRVDTLDVSPESNPTILANVLDWDYGAIPPGTYQVVYASPPCTLFSRANLNANEEDVEVGVRVAIRCFEICVALATVVWIVENPVNRLVDHPDMTRYDAYRRPTTYCHWGTLYKKPTNVWTNAPIDALPYCSAEDPCPHVQEDGRHPRTSQSGTTRRADGTTIRGTPPSVAQNMPFRLLRRVVSTVAIVAGGEDAERLTPPGSDLACVACGRTDDENTMLLCDGCDTPYHAACLDEPLESIPVGDWYCEYCEGG